MSNQTNKPQGVIRTVFGLKARFCNDGCRDSFQCDREHGLVYGPYQVTDPKTKQPVQTNVGQASIIGHFCAYCNAPLA